MTTQEEYELLALGLTPEEIKEIKKAEKTAKQDMK